MDELTKRFTDLAQQFAPQIRDLALQTAQIEAYRHLTDGCVAALTGLALFKVGQHIWRYESASPILKSAGQFSSPLRATHQSPHSAKSPAEMPPLNLIITVQPHDR